jgi:hypothetical protein
VDGVSFRLTRVEAVGKLRAIAEVPVVNLTPATFTIGAVGTVTVIGTAAEGLIVLLALVDADDTETAMGIVWVVSLPNTYLNLVVESVLVIGIAADE